MKRESEQHHWKNDQYQHMSHIHPDVHQHVQERHEQEQHQHHLEFRYETNENDQKFTSDNRHVDFHIKHETHNQQAYHINQQQESNTSHHQQQQQQQHHHDYHEQKESNQEEQKERHYQHNIQQMTDFIQPSHDSTHNSEHKTTETIVNEQNNYSSNIIDKQTDEQKLISHPSSEPCTDLHNVATQSDLNLTGHLDSSNVSNSVPILVLLN
ncbi:PREDICTED: G-box-binding factor-like [Polistes dominula]|uniref:G-box-binding factor-like n=1 Tax=Polistes dominula TaxID=743375 RepID=A0ABM1ILW2_POLDO|nr:PREDICTED: G-box-binding factor-like [Polistes dominula]